MKRYLIIIVFCIICAKDYGQTPKFSNVFLGSNFMYYKNAQLTVNPNSISGFDNRFYSDLRYCQNRFDKNILYPSKEYSYISCKDSLIGHVFIVNRIIDKNNDSFTGILDKDDPIFVLEDYYTKKIIYFIYDYNNPYNFPFLSYNINQEYFCDKISVEKDDFTNDTTYRSPLDENGRLLNILLEKINSNGIKYYLILHTTASTCVVDGEDAILLFEDGLRMKFNIKINVDVTNDGFRYSAFIPIEKAKINLLTQKKIKKFRLYIFDQEIADDDADNFLLYSKCIINK